MTTDNKNCASNNFLARFKDKNSNTLKHFTAAQFVEIWNHYDTDGNGFIEGTELDKFLNEFIYNVFMDQQDNAHTQDLSAEKLHQMKQEFMKAFDENADNRIELCEMAKVLPTDENFILLFHKENPLESSVEFMRVWKRFDKDRSGYIEADELKSFLQHLLLEAKPDTQIDDSKLTEYTSSMLELFDQNKDGKLQLSEMARLLPVKENYLSRPIFRNTSKINAADIDRAFALYDLDGNGTIENEELAGFLKDLMELVQETYEERDLEFFKNVILSQWDVNNDGKINREELKMLLVQQSHLMVNDRKTH